MLVHIQALPVDTLLSERSIDIILTNEGVYACNLLKLNNFDQEHSKYKGSLPDWMVPFMTLPEKTVPQNLLEEDYQDMHMIYFQIRKV